MNWTIYLNMKTSQGIETVDEFSLDEFMPYAKTNRPVKEFRQYVSEMVQNYHLSGMAVYRSSRCTKEWRNK